jgi:hypothetical protein
MDPTWIRDIHFFASDSAEKRAEHENLPVDISSEQHINNIRAPNWMQKEKQMLCSFAICDVICDSRCHTFGAICSFAIRGLPPFAVCVLFV